MAFISKFDFTESVVLERGVCMCGVDDDVYLPNAEVVVGGGSNDNCQFLVSHTSPDMMNFARRFIDVTTIISRSFSGDRILKLSNLHYNPGAFKKRKRVGRGMGSGRGKTSGHGHGTCGETGISPRAFEGGQTPLYKTMPKIGFHNFM